VNAIDEWFKESDTVGEDVALLETTDAVKEVTASFSSTESTWDATTEAEVNLPSSASTATSSSSSSSSTTTGKRRNNSTTDGKSVKRSRCRPGTTAKGGERRFVQHNYRDHADSIPEGGDIDLSVYTSDGTFVKKLRTAPFPIKLHIMFANMESQHLTDITSWFPHGRAFIIHQPKLFVSQIMPQYFKQSKMTSFNRQLNLYGFQRITSGTDRGGYYSEYFLRTKPFLTKLLKRHKVKGTKVRPASSPEHEPDFYSMSFLPLSDISSYKVSFEIQSEQQVAPVSTVSDSTALLELVGPRRSPMNDGSTINLDNSGATISPSPSMSASVGSGKRTTSSGSNNNADGSFNPAGPSRNFPVSSAAAPTTDPMPPLLPHLTTSSALIPELRPYDITAQLRGFEPLTYRFNSRDFSKNLNIMPNSRPNSGTAPHTIYAPSRLQQQQRQSLFRNYESLGSVPNTPVQSTTTICHNPMTKQDPHIMQTPVATNITSNSSVSVFEPLPYSPLEDEKPSSSFISSQDTMQLLSAPVVPVPQRGVTTSAVAYNPGVSNNHHFQGCYPGKFSNIYANVNDYCKNDIAMASDHVLDGIVDSLHFSGEEQGSLIDLFHNWDDSVDANELSS